MTMETGMPSLRMIYSNHKNGVDYGYIKYPRQPRQLVETSRLRELKKDLVELYGENRKNLSREDLENITEITSEVAQGNPQWLKEGAMFIDDDGLRVFNKLGNRPAITIREKVSSPILKYLASLLDFGRYAEDETEYVWDL